MSSDRDFVEFVCGQITDAGAITSRKMFGEYAVYCDGKVIGLVCENRFYVKQTENGLAFIGEAVMAPAYPGAPPSFVVDDHLDDREWMSGLIRLTVRELQTPGVGNKRKKRASGDGKQKPGGSGREVKV